MTEMFRFSPQSTRGAERLAGLPEPVCAALNEVMDRSEAEGFYRLHDNSGFDHQRAFTDILNAYEALARAGTPPVSASDVIAYLDGPASA